eukprot:998317-Pelagomonas_calceolata.AAC.4
MSAPVHGSQYKAQETAQSNTIIFRSGHGSISKCVKSACIPKGKAFKYGVKVTAEHQTRLLTFNFEQSKVWQHKGMILTTRMGTSTPHLHIAECKPCTCSYVRGGSGADHAPYND